MNFTIERVVENGFSLIRLMDNKSGTYVSIMPGAGGLIHEFSIRLPNAVSHSHLDYISIIDNYKNEAELEGYLALSYKGCKLSPFACRIADGKWSFMGKQYEFKSKFKDGSAIHGLLYNKTFNISDEFADENMATVSLRYHYKIDDPGYPFNYVCETRYILQPGNVLQLETTLTNLDDSEIPVTDGWHPYFNLGNKVDDYIIQFGSAAMLEFDDRLVPTGKILEEPSFQVPHRLGEREIDNCYVLNADPGLPCCVLYNPLTKLTVSFFASEAYPYLQVFTPKHRDSIAIENLSGAPDNFNNGIGLTRLAPRRSKTFNAWYRAEFSE
ncbi:MAG: aldose 1-epimerase [Chitinophagaceae bacterium]|nr:MAG: aldose 1-epimerase [Chitinophagaceae bacterium]